MLKKNSDRVLTKQETLVCSMCDEPKKPYEFYQSFDDLNKSGYVPICKKCITLHSMPKGSLDIDKLKEMLQRTDKPYLPYILNQAINTGRQIPGEYFKLLALPRTRDLRWIDSEEDEIIDEEYDSTNDEKIVHKSDFNGRWIGHKYINAVHMENFYQNMKRDNRIETAQDEVYLSQLALMNLEMDLAGKKGEWDKFKKISDTFSKFMGDAKLRTMDKTQSDLTGGIKSFGNIFAEIEKDDFIPPWKEYAKINGVKQDIVDKTIMHIENFTLRLNKINRMVEPPENCPIPDSWEIDEDASYTDIAVSLSQDDIIASESD
ncbi:MAG: hypothetical protein D4S01_02330 [Dehalococcoidia bacterium]|nr:MAG: hypothetical protein D4S01_02330 [Dehalococcoidia bacterium]